MSGNGRYTNGDTAEAPTRRVILSSFADIKPKPLNPLWRGRFYVGKINLVYGNGGLGKSLATLDMAARVSTGSPWPDGAEGVLGSVIVISAEDDPEDTIAPRLLAAGADMAKVKLLEGEELSYSDGRVRERSFTLADVPVLETALQDTPDCKLVIIDPISAFLDGTDSHRDAEIRQLLKPIKTLAERQGVCVLLVTHMRKGGGAGALQRVIGSIGIGAAARSAWLVVKDKDNPNRRLFLSAKNNLGPDINNGLAYTITAGQEDHPRVVWERGAVTTTADDAVEIESRDDGRQTKQGEATEWLRELLADAGGALAVPKIKEQAQSAGYSWATVRRAQGALGIKPYKPKGYFDGVWYWRLPDVAQPLPSPNGEQHREPEQHRIPDSANGVSDPLAGVSFADVAQCSDTQEACATSLTETDARWTPDDDAEALRLVAAVEAGGAA